MVYFGTIVAPLPVHESLLQIVSEGGGCSLLGRMSEGLTRASIRGDLLGGHFDKRQCL